jgi:hypothetical protein
VVYYDVVPLSLPLKASILRSSPERYAITLASIDEKSETINLINREGWTKFIYGRRKN